MSVCSPLLDHAVLSSLPGHPSGVGGVGHGFLLRWEKVGQKKRKGTKKEQREKRRHQFVSVACLLFARLSTFGRVLCSLCTRWLFLLISTQSRTRTWTRTQGPRPLHGLPSIRKRPEGPQRGTMSTCACCQAVGLNPLFFFFFFVSLPPLLQWRFIHSADERPYLYCTYRLKEEYRTMQLYLHGLHNQFLENNKLSKLEAQAGGAAIALTQQQSDQLYYQVRTKRISITWEQNCSIEGCFLAAEA